ncbi:uncharacterized protein N7459_005168 [Penicillium hispanicum]|uniref:uncharacterized protein n=1 Tax=Penicillium hispanicum TaxID=1080232 RepID=UPI002541E9F0|nr:uncharacterized protein N7459_005168 [Penicillium hispanicum]KAJ5585368.1 hypothetical protein N7459_005168 [Penicillium hispanicum]
MDTEVDIAPESLFRSAKRRKFVRRRPDDNTDENGASSEAAAESSGQARLAPESQLNPDGEKEENALATGVARLRRPHAIRKGGIGFSATSRPGRDENRQTALGPAVDTEKEKVQAMRDRFTVYTGQTVDVDKHMMAYIDSEMAKRHRRSPLPESQEGSRPALPQTSGEQPIHGLQERMPASLGKLHEIDLGQETTMQNIARTEAATRRLVGDEVSPAPGAPGMQEADRFGPDGKQWRNRKRRTSADIERDRLVEEVLRESKLDVYDEPDDDPEVGDQAADDRIAEQFRRDFLDALQTRRRIGRPRTTKTDPKAEVPKGPKLGGSRSARAAMREMQGKAGQK